MLPVFQTLAPAVKAELAWGLREGIFIILLSHQL